jgi:PhzF family phenazine biosynthesis protein
MKLKVQVVDAFADEVFKGNQAAVILTQEWLSEDLMQSIASENNLAETAYAVADDQGVYGIRWFSPLTEIDFCGHATLATAFVLFNQISTLTILKFYAKAVGELEVLRCANGRIQMSFPNRQPQRLDEIPASLIAGLSIAPQEVWRSQQAYFAVYENEADVLAVQQNIEQVKLLAPYDVVVTAASAQYDFVSRYFWPANGGDEDPVTGSIHAGLTPFWADRLNKSSLVAYQASQRGGVLYCDIDGERVNISGNAVQYLEGVISI